MASKYDNRTDPVFADTNCLNTVNLALTTRCSMVCPNCSVDVPAITGTAEARHTPPSLIRSDALSMKPMRRVHLTGGEPTIYPNFDPVARSVRSWFGAQYVTIETNGVGYKRYR